MNKLSIISKALFIIGAVLWFVSAITMIYSSFNLCKSSITFDDLFYQVRTSSIILIIGCIVVISSVITHILYKRKSRQ